MDDRLESEVVKRCRLFEDLEDSLRIRQDVLDKIQLDIEGRVDCIKDLNEKSRKNDLENTDLEFKRRKIARELDALYEEASTIERDNTRLSSDIIDMNIDTGTLNNKKHQIISQIDQSEDLQNHVV